MIFQAARNQNKIIKCQTSVITNQPNWCTFIRLLLFFKEYFHHTFFVAFPPKSFISVPLWKTLLLFLYMFLGKICINKWNIIYFIYAYLLIQQERMVGRLENIKAFIRWASFHICFEQQPKTHSRGSAWSPGEVLYVNQHGILLHVELVSDQQQLDQLLIQTWTEQRERERETLAWGCDHSVAAGPFFFSLLVCVCFTCCLSGILPSACPNYTKVWLWQTLRRGIRWVKNTLFGLLGISGAGSCKMRGYSSLSTELADACRPLTVNTQGKLLTVKVFELTYRKVLSHPL